MLLCIATDSHAGDTLQQGNSIQDTVLSDAHLTNRVEGGGAILGPGAVNIPLILTPLNSSLPPVDIHRSLCFHFSCPQSDQDLPVGTGLESNTVKYS